MFAHELVPLALALCHRGVDVSSPGAAPIPGLDVALVRAHPRGLHRDGVVEVSLSVVFVHCLPPGALLLLLVLSVTVLVPVRVPQVLDPLKPFAALLFGVGAQQTDLAAASLDDEGKEAALEVAHVGNVGRVGALDVPDFGGAEGLLVRRLRVLVVTESILSQDEVPVLIAAELSSPLADCALHEPSTGFTRRRKDLVDPGGDARAGLRAVASELENGTGQSRHQRPVAVVPDEALQIHAEVLAGGELPDASFEQEPTPLAALPIGVVAELLQKLAVSFVLQVGVLQPDSYNLIDENVAVHARAVTHIAHDVLELEDGHVNVLLLPHLGHASLELVRAVVEHLVHLPPDPSVGDRVVETPANPLVAALEDTRVGEVVGVSGRLEDYVMETSPSLDHHLHVAGTLGSLELNAVELIKRQVKVTSEQLNIVVCETDVGGFFDDGKHVQLPVQTPHGVLCALDDLVDLDEKGFGVLDDRLVVANLLCPGEPLDEAGPVALDDGLLEGLPEGLDGCKDLPCVPHSFDPVLVF
mmetsp:Transcript_20835/g.38953  ORF Transcript_20835/g.38953 Transcript_20835/m.38953 type:complete len:528 (-) Transcript_20835:3911-5494(-)